MKKTFISIITCFLIFLNFQAFAVIVNVLGKNQTEAKNSQTSESGTVSKSPYGSFEKGDTYLGVYMALGYNILSHVDGSLATIPNKLDILPRPGQPVYSSKTTFNLVAPCFAYEHWFSRGISLRGEIGINLIVAGADYFLSDFAYIYLYAKSVLGARFYLGKNVKNYFMGTGIFLSLPLTNPLIGFISAKSGSRVNFGPYIETGINFPVNYNMSIEANMRFSLALLDYSVKSNKNILATVRTSPLDLGVGINYKI